MIPVASCFSQLLSLVDRASFARAVRQHQGERGAKGFSCWDQFVAMLFLHEWVEPIHCVRSVAV